MAYQWVSADLLTLQVIADLPGFDPNWPLRRTLSSDDQGSGVLHLTDDTPPNWRDATRGGGALLACYDDTALTDGTTPNPIVWAGYVVDSSFTFENDDVQVSLATFEAVLDRAYVGDVTYPTTAHRDDILADLITSWFIPGTGITVSLDYTPGGGPTPVEAIVMQNADNATVKARFDQVCGQLGGEYTVEWAWSTDGAGLVATVRFGGHVGAVAGSDGPLVVFDAPGHITSLSQKRSYAASDGANKVVGYSSGSGDYTPYSAPVYAPADGRPTFEYRYQPAPSISPTAVAQYVRQAVKILGPGKQPITCQFTEQLPVGRRLGVDWKLGDDIGLAVAASYINEQGDRVLIRAFPDGLDVTARCIAYDFDDATITPQFADTAVYVANA